MGKKELLKENITDLEALLTAMFNEHLEDLRSFVAIQNKPEALPVEKIELMKRISKSKKEIHDTIKRMKIADHEI